MRSRARTVLLGLLASFCVCWAMDYAVWRIRVAAGGGVSNITVDQFLATPLKGQKESYDYIGPLQAPCTRSIFPHGGAPACWWLARHRNVWE